MATNLLSTATGAATSATFSLTEGQTTTIVLKDAAGPDVEHGGQVVIEMQDDAGQFFIVDTLTTSKRAGVLSAAGTFRVRRIDNGATVGAFRG